jgi:hypothetical protein
VPLRHRLRGKQKRLGQRTFSLKLELRT